jgi:hypothetical protein
MKRTFFVAAAIAAVGISSCSGGGGSGAATPSAPGALTPASGVRVMDVTFAGTSTLARTRQTQSLAGTPVTATSNGKTVATGTLDAHGHATLSFTADVPRGATVLVTAGSVSATIVLAQSDDGTLAQVQVNGDGTLTVSASAEHPGTNGASPSPNPGQDDESINEDDHGNPTIIVTTLTSLPSNLPITIVAACGSLTFAPVNGPIAQILIEMKGHDDDTSAKFMYSGSLNGPLTLPINVSSARIHIRIPGANGGTRLDIKGPIDASTSGSSTSPCPSASPSATPTATQSASPSPLPSVSPVASASPAASLSPSPSATP